MCHAARYSVDQYASKVVERAIKYNDPNILQEYLNKITIPPADHKAHPRLPLIDIANDQYGNVRTSTRDDEHFANQQYLIQYILLHGSSEQQATIICHIRKHMVSMRGSRYGAKVAFIVERMRQNENGGSRTARDYRTGMVNRLRNDQHARSSNRMARMQYG